MAVEGESALVRNSRDQREEFVVFPLAGWGDFVRHVC
jgi:hypothetical protein